MFSAESEFTITRTLNVRPEQVWRAWTEEEELAGWVPSISRETISFDVRKSGRYRFAAVDDDTGQEYPAGGEFLEVSPFERLVFTWGDPNAPIESMAVVTLNFTGVEDNTEMTFHLRGFEDQPGEQSEYDGWSDVLDSLTKYLDNHDR